MSSVTSVFVVVGDSGDGAAEEVAPKVAEAVAEVIRETAVNPDAAAHLPVISNSGDGDHPLQGGSKPGGGAVIWFAWNYGRPVDLEQRLQERGFENITVWSQHELHGSRPRVTSW
ncbi:hypothetical protein [Streptomyces sp. MZ04]|uniref:hypothetical protein n=1 Tax=Streptomyces sp. MZ04 TaxID=2559236 RepID=UPI00107EE6F2|nr:hypothetical protein [Streptomyces sp. MZ04]TGB13857.1 hypothetical protein E2651_07925 [Streptomyces sp. MZ04]